MTLKGAGGVASSTDCVAVNTDGEVLATAGVGVVTCCDCIVVVVYTAK